MGLIATYSCLSDANLKELKAMGSEEEEILESVEDSIVATCHACTSRR